MDTWLSVRIVKPIGIRADTMKALPYISARIVSEAGMPKWKKGATEFTVGVSYSDAKGVQTRLPRPIAELLGNPDSITFVIHGKRIELTARAKSSGNQP